MPLTIEQARKTQAAEQQRAREIADEQMKKAGFTRTPGFTPQPRAAHPYQPEAERPSAPLEPSPPLDLSKAGEARTKRRVFGVGQGD